VGYGFGFLESYFKINILRRKPEIAFPELFFKNEIESVEELKFEINNVSKPILAKVDEIDKHNSVNSNFEKTKIIGLTGGIGSGKTTIANYIKSKGIPVYLSDLEAKKVMELPEIISKIVKVFGIDVLGKNNLLDREKLATLVFNNTNNLKKLNEIVHPAVKNNFDHWVINHKNHPVIVKETAILFESGSYKNCDVIISVTAPLETRINRVLKRDTTNREKIVQRINNQLTDKERADRSDYVITNENFEDTKKQVDKILNLLLKR